MADLTTMLDIARATDPDGKPAKVINILQQQNPILMDAPAYRSNAQMAQKTTLTSSLPTVQFAQLNKGTVQSRATTRQVTDTIAFIDGLNEVDARFEDTNGIEAMNAERRRQDVAFLEAMNQLVALTMLYGSELTSPQSFTGLAPRMASLADDITGSQVWNGAALQAVVGGDGTSIYIVDWGEDACHLIFPKDAPKDSAAGVQVVDQALQRVTDVAGNPFMAYSTAYKWLVGLTVKDPRHIARLANVDESDANIASPAQGQLTNNLLDVIGNMPGKMGNRRVMYTSRRILTGFSKQALNKSNAALTLQAHLNEVIPHFHGVPIRSLDQITSGESTVS